MRIIFSKSFCNQSLPKPIMSIIERSEPYQTLSISSLKVGDNLVNLGPILELAELNDSFSVVIYRMRERQVWRFDKNEQLLIKSEDQSL